MMPVIFDLDGTLVDSAPDIHAAINAMLADQGQPPLSLSTVTSFVGHGLARLVQRVIAHLGLDPAAHERLTALTFTKMTAAAAGLTQLYPGVIASLSALRAAGHPLGLCTNKPEPAALAVLHSMGLSEFFSVVVGGGRLAVLKPDPGPLLLTLQQMGASQAIFVGDSEVDAETAQRAGLPFLLFTQGYRHTAVDMLPHHAAFDDFAALPALVATLAAQPG